MRLSCILLRHCSPDAVDVNRKKEAVAPGRVGQTPTKRVTCFSFPLRRQNDRGNFVTVVHLLYLTVVRPLSGAKEREAWGTWFLKRSLVTLFVETSHFIKKELI